MLHSLPLEITKFLIQFFKEVIDMNGTNMLGKVNMTIVTSEIGTLI